MLGETEKPVVSCYALGEWRVSPYYFTLTFSSPAGGPERFYFQGHFFMLGYWYSGASNDDEEEQQHVVMK